MSTVRDKFKCMGKSGMQGVILMLFSCHRLCGRPGE